MSGLVPTPITDKNGKQTTVHRKGTVIPNSRSLSVSPKPSVATVHSRYGDNGIHWSKSSNPRLKELAREMAWKFADINVDDIDEESDGTIELEFGSTGAQLYLRRIDQESLAIYGNGYCGMLAWAMHEKTGLPFAVFSAPNPQNRWHGHAALYIDDDTILDINGVHKISDVADQYSELDGSFDVMGADEFSKLVVSEKYEDAPMEFLGELEQLVTRDFAEFIVARDLDIE